MKLPHRRQFLHLSRRRCRAAGIAHLSNGKRSLHCEISIPPMSEVGQNR